MSMNTERIKLGQTEVQVPRLGIGTWSWGSRFFWSYGTTHTDADIRQAFHASIAAGVNFFDTAEAYGRGHSERLLGQLIKETKCSAIIATKFVPYPWRLRRVSLLSALRNSLSRLGLSQVDLYQVHLPLPPISTEIWMEAMSDAYEAGWIRAVGVSNYSVAQTRRAYAALEQRGIALASNQVEYNLLQRAPENNGLLAECRALGVTLIAYSPLGQGLLTGKYSPENRPPGLGRRRYTQRRLAAIQPLVARLREIGEAHDGKTPAQVALNWVICKGSVPIPGAKNARQAEQNAQSLGWRLTDDEIAILDVVSAEVG
jgi:aryl-alcohol dehydrogenase-like predicted oxidoreductase